MEVKRFLGYRLDKVEEVLKEKGIKYELVFTNNPKNVLIGEEKRVIKIKDLNDKIIIYYSYF
ncbi:hypothetical protein [Thermobrachium celere]|uniref:PASTA domain-containing protein n=1 Tax=Thermobrachium celere DSM 8682 TaxID=941824 RepID=R7RPF1_9CLOT|nr:hypothetical protein [Thermobrachium celere]CDF57939.1 hypothetical protein TCEL_01853 [Thermobrachium celere DSM 8682]